MIHKGEVNSSAAQTILDVMINKGGDPTQIMNTLGLKIIDDEVTLEKEIKKAIAKHPEQTADYKKGKTNLIQFFVGQVMASTKGAANPETVRKLLEKFLNE
jgi:aspartyl-tRNA(Asn)/glutamyl-tRNA(Gln) amidotransferase subunit B